MPELPRGLKDFEVGETFTGFFVIRRRELRTKKDGGFYLSVEFGDRTGRLSGNIWDDAESLFERLRDGEVVKLQGYIETYRDARMVGVRRIRPVNAEDEFDPAALIPSSSVDPQAALERIRRMIERLADPDVKRLLQAFFLDESFCAAFCKAPAGKLWHHNRLGGLAEHTLSMARLVWLLARFYPEANRDLLLAGALLHDIGKIEEYRYDTMIDYSDRGRLVGHIPLGAQWAAERAASLEHFPPAILDQVMHLILSHQAEHGSPIQPATREAFILHYADQIDSKMDALRRISEDSGSGRWKFVKLLDRFIDTGEPS